MEERRFVKVRKEELAIKEFIKKSFGIGKIGNVRMEYTPVGESIIISTHKPGLIIGKKGERIAELTEILKKRFKMENPHVDIEEIMKPELDAKIVADEMALALERFGAARYKAVGYRALQKIKDAGALGVEIRISGKIPSDRARTSRFAFGYLKKTGDSAKVVDRAESVATTKKGVIGIKVAILSPDAKLHDRIDVNEDLINELKRNKEFNDNEEQEKKTKKKVVKKKTKKESEEKTKVKEEEPEKKEVKENVKVKKVKEEKK